MYGSKMIQHQTLNREKHQIRSGETVVKEIKMWQFFIQCRLNPLIAPSEQLSFAALKPLQPYHLQSLTLEDDVLYSYFISSSELIVYYAFHVMRTQQNIVFTDRVRRKRFANVKLLQD